MATVAPPAFVPNPRLDVLVTSVAGEPLRSTTYSGLMQFGERRQVGGLSVTGGSMAYVEFRGPAFLPDGLRYGGPELGAAVVASSVWLATALGDRTQIRSGTAQWVPDPRDPNQVWLALALDVFGTAGLVTGYRVEVQVPPAAVLGDPVGVAG